MLQKYFFGYGSYRQYILQDNFRSKNFDGLGKLTNLELNIYVNSSYITARGSLTPIEDVPTECKLKIKYENGFETYLAFNAENCNLKWFLYEYEWVESSVINRKIFDINWNDNIFRFASSERKL